MDTMPTRGGLLATTAPWGWRRLHRASAWLVGGFVALHLANHLVAVFSLDAHVAVMAWLRHLYRAPLVEPLLLAAVAWQAGSGIWLVVRGWAVRRGRVAWLQAASGLGLALFLLVHVSAVLWARGTGLDTNVYFAAMGLQARASVAFFAPYYFGAVLALGVHGACAARRHAVVRPAGLVGGVAASALVGLAIVLSLAGAFAPVILPPAYRAVLLSWGLL